jgi:hypothetical protein
MHSLFEFNDRRPSKAVRATEGPYAGQVRGYERGNSPYVNYPDRGDYLDIDSDVTAQEAFNAHGFNKGKAGDMAKNIQSNVDKSVARSGYDVEKARNKSQRHIDRSK